MEKYSNTKPLRLLPYKFRFIGCVIGGVVALIPLLLQFCGVDFGKDFHYTNVLEVVLLVVLLVFVISKGKNGEDERSLQIRVNAFGGAFIFGVVSFIVHKIFDIFEIVVATKELSASQIMLNMFFWYFFIHWLMKRRG